MRRLVQHAAVGVACTALAVTAAMTGLGSPAATGTTLAVPASVTTPAQPGADPSVSASVAAERAARQAALNRSNARDRLVRTAVEHAVQRDAALTAQGRSINAQQAKIVAERKAAAAAAKARKAKARAEAVAEAKAQAEAAREELAREEAAAARAQAAAAAEQARLERVRAQGYEPGTTDPREMARQILQNKFGYGAEEFSCFDDVIIRESGWDIDATNPTSGAYGIPQALPGSKMASAGSDWRTNPATQIIWAVGYMDGRYGSPCAAWSFKSAHGWY